MKDFSVASSSSEPSPWGSVSKFVVAMFLGAGLGITADRTINDRWSTPPSPTSSPVPTADAPGTAAPAPGFVPMPIPSIPLPSDAPPSNSSPWSTPDVGTRPALQDLDLGAKIELQIVGRIVVGKENRNLGTAIDFNGGGKKCRLYFNVALNDGRVIEPRIIAVTKIVKEYDNVTLRTDGGAGGEKEISALSCPLLSAGHPTVDEVPGMTGNQIWLLQHP